MNKRPLTVETAECLTATDGQDMASHTELNQLKSL